MNIFELTICIVFCLLGWNNLQCCGIK